MSRIETNLIGRKVACGHFSSDIGKPGEIVAVYLERGDLVACVANPDGVIYTQRVDGMKIEAPPHKPTPPAPPPKR